MRLQIVLCSVLFSSLCSIAQSISVPIAGNTWSSAKENRNLAKIGIREWQNKEQQFTTYIRVATPGTIKFSITAASPSGNATLGITALSKTHKVEIHAQKEYEVGEWVVKDSGYIAFTFSGIAKDGCCFPDINSLELSGSAINEQTSFVKNNEGNFFYWGRRGPSTHLNYQVPKDVDVEWFYNEITVPEGNDIIGSYFMANGFGEGYFGMQVNSDTERRILFSVWSPFTTDNPKEIPEEQRIKLLKKGPDVNTGEFGGEGSGGQSFLRYNWKAGTTQKFLLRGVPDGADHTIYTAYFFDNEQKIWRLIASFRRPKKSTYLTRLHSFLENFNPTQGNIDRKVLFSNQWVKDTKGKWHQLTKAKFTADNTARIGYRKDFEGGADKKSFYLHAFGFFKEQTPIGKWLEREPVQEPPSINFDSLK